MVPFNYKFHALLTYLIFILTVVISAQQNPDFDNTYGMDIPESIPLNGPLGREIMVDEDGFDNFFLGVDFAEPHISSNPTNATEYFNAFNTNATHYTYDGFEWFFQTPGFGAVMRGDPVTAYDSLGNLYYENMFGAGNIEGCKVIVSTDNGATWSPSVTAIAGVDKNWIAADQTSGPYANYVYTTMTAGSGSGRFARSTDLGVTWQATFQPGNQNLPGMMVAVGPNVIGGDVPGGAVYVVTNGGNTFSPIYTFYLSTNGGSSFVQKSAQAFANYVGINSNGRHSVENMRTRPYPFIAADNSYGAYRGRLYLVYASNTPVGNGNKPDIFCRYSTDQGVTWSSAIIINDDPNTTANHQWHPSIWCDKTTGRLYAKWFDTRNTPTSDSAEVYASYSDDGGVTWVQNQKLSTSKFKIDCTSCGGGGTPRYQGDYDAITSNEITSMAVWSDFRFGNFGSFVAYFPDFAMTVSELADTLKPMDSLDVSVNIPAVKLYDNSVEFSAEVIPAGSFDLEFPGGTTINTFPNSIPLKIISNNALTGDYVVRVVGKGPNGTPVHNRDIEILITNPFANVVQPNGGEILYVGTLYPIQFEKIFIDTVKIEYSTDNGNSWIAIAEQSSNLEGDLPTAGISEFDWVVPNTVSTECLIRISDKSDPSVFDISDAAFSIESTPFAGWREQTSGIDSTILCISIVDTSVAWAGSKSGIVMRSTDGGDTWNEIIADPLAGDINSIYALNSARAFVAINSGSGARVLRTINGGNTWTTIYENTDSAAFINSVEMFGFIDGYITGNPINGNWLLLNTTDGGFSWNPASVLPQIGSELGFANSVEWIDIANGWFGTSDGHVYYTTDSGISWSSASTTISNIKSLSFADEFLGMAAGDGIDITTDGGQSWTQSVTQLQNEVTGSAAARLTESRWYFISGSEIYKTSDQGLNLALDYAQTSDYKHITMKVVQLGENSWICGYAVGDNGIISKYIELETVTEVVEEEEVVPSDFVLLQNYPNPFNPTTRIDFSLPVSSEVRLVIYNMLGEEVAILMNEQKNHGNHSVVWNGRDSFGNKLSSGIYFYKIDASGIDESVFTDIRKMVLLK